MQLTVRRAQRGLSIVEMMVGVAIGLIVVAGASLLVSSQLAENRRLLVETQLQQDMRATMDIITRELRRIGAQKEAPALLGLASPSAGAIQNPMASASPTTHTNAGDPGVETLEFHYEPAQGEDDFGFRRNGGVVQSKLSAAGWQELTDPNVLTVTALVIKPTHSALLQLPCPKRCPPPPTGGPGGTDCWPHVMVRDVLVEMTAHPRNEPTLLRTLSSRVRVRNDVVKFNVSPTEICPA